MFWKVGRMALLALAAGLTHGCTEVPNATTPLAEQPPSVRPEMLVTTQWLESRLEDAGVIVVHVGREREGYDAGHIPGARFLARSDVAVSREGLPNELPPVENLVSLVRRLGIEADNRVVLYDEGEGLDAARAYVAFDYLGLGDRTALLDGHWKKWRAEDRRVATAAPPVVPSSYVPSVNPDVVIHLQAVRDLAWRVKRPESRVAIVDARPEVNYTGEEGGREITRPGHIPGAASVFWQRNLVSADNPVLRPVAELRALYAEAGVGPDDLLVTYCRSGMQASHTYFTAKYLGYKPRLYDASYIEWSAAKDTPVEAARR